MTEPSLAPGDVDTDPIVTCRLWYEAAAGSGEALPHAMALATVDAHGRPSNRMVLLKGIDDRGFRFFTNHESRKGIELAANPDCALVLHWASLERQICVRGRAERLPSEDSALYFATRPRRSRLAAWASHQSQVIADRDVLDRRMAELEAAYPGQTEVPLPPHWGGYLVVPRAVELWQGRPDRLHDRLRYRRDGDGPWILERLAP